jgi:antirestriction protein ArdC
MTTETTTPTAPFNPTTGKCYSGGNVATLLDATDEKGWATPEFAGYGQWQKAGRQVVEKGAVTLTRWVPVKDKKTGKVKLNADGSKKLRPTKLTVFNKALTLPADEAAVLKAERDALKAAA